MRLFLKATLAIVPIFSIAMVLANSMAFHVFLASENSEDTNQKLSGLSTPEIVSPATSGTRQAPSVAVSLKSPSDFIVFSALSIGFSVVFLAFLIYAIINQYVIRPITYLRHASEEVSKGNFNVKLNTAKGDEISSLSRSFLEMCINLKSSNARIHKLAFFDEVTQLPNRRSYKDDIKNITTNISKDKKCAVILIDLDHFKEINDLHGHTTGDSLLIGVAELLVERSRLLAKETSPSIESFVYRVAGDEFIVILNDLSTVNEAIEITKKLQASMGLPMLVDGKTFTAKCSIGVAAYPLHSVHPDSLFQYADMAMHEAKKQGRGKCCVFDESFLNKIIIESDMEADIRSAINNDEFYLVFQPKYAVKTQVTNEFEALIRWRHPEKGHISPGTFIPFAEDRNLINEIGIWVIEDLCKTIKYLEKDGWKHFCISFNTSPKQLQDVAFIRHLQHCIDNYGIDPIHLEMEITEHSIASNFDKTIIALDHVRNMGLSISIDDFGTGYSSLSYLRRMPINTIKIDKVFISDALQNHKSRTVVETILTLANGLGMKTVAEGVETIEEFKYVCDQGCDYVQGYYFAKPMPLNELSKYKSQSNDVRLVACE